MNSIEFNSIILFSLSGTMTCRPLSSVTPWEMLARRKDGDEGKISMGCPELDTFLRGGVVRGTITELTGEAGTGKTQLCLQLLLQSVLMAGTNHDTRLGHRAVYISTEGEFPMKRMLQLCEQLLQRYPSLCPRAVDVLDHILLASAQTIEDLSQLILHQLPSLLQPQGSRQGGDVQLIVVDSVTALVRGDFDRSQIYERNTLLLQLAAHLKRVADQFDLAVVVTNHVTDRVGEHTVNRPRIILPALGLAWSNCVNVRLALFRPPRVVDDGTDHLTTPRTLLVTLAPHLPNASLSFVIEAEGVRGLRTQ